jgi:PAS domain-containing protein
MIDECKRVLEHVGSIAYISEQHTGKLIFANKAARELLGIADDSYIGRDSSEFFEELDTSSDGVLSGACDDSPSDHSDGAVQCGQMLIRQTGVRMNTVSTVHVEEDAAYLTVISEESRNELDQKQVLNQIVENEMVVTEALSVAMEQ